MLLSQLLFHLLKFFTSLGNHLIDRPLGKAPHTHTLFDLVEAMGQVRLESGPWQGAGFQNGGQSAVRPKFPNRGGKTRGPLSKQGSRVAPILKMSPTHGGLSFWPPVKTNQKGAPKQRNRGSGRKSCFPRSRAFAASNGSMPHLVGFARTQ